jgi:hypothetical protein
MRGDDLRLKSRVADAVRAWHCGDGRVIDATLVH